ncbi:hypothetical protein, partial [Pseudomonas aeruginosa]|uniref:hypothetical protein n=1 Tax=Pseudomonas aeruginosa TaxID=287 RepID=UPI001F19B36F
MMFVSEQVRLDGSALLHGWCQRTKSGQRNFTNRRGAEVFRGALILVDLINLVSGSEYGPWRRVDNRPSS